MLMKKLLVSLLVVAAALHTSAQLPGPDAATGTTTGRSNPVIESLLQKKVLLPNGWSLTPAGTSLPLGDLPLNIAVSSSGHYAAVTNNGQSTQTLQLIDVQQEKILDSVIIPKSWLGLLFSADEKWLYAGGGNDNRILKYAVHVDKGAGQAGLVLTDSIVLGKKWPEKISPAGMDIDERRNLLYVVTKENNSLYIVDLAAKTVLQRIELGGEGYTCRLSRDRKELYITCWGCDKLLVFDTENRRFAGDIAVGDNPNDICLTKNNRWLFVSNANDNSVSVIDIRNRKVVETLNAALYADAPPGSTSNALALSADQKSGDSWRRRSRSCARSRGAGEQRVTSCVHRCCDAERRASRPCRSS